MDRIEVVVVVETAGEDPHSEWMTAEAGWTTNRDEAVVFSFSKGNTARDRLKVRRIRHRLAGGLSVFSDREQAIDRTRKALNTQIRTKLWGDDPPEPKAGSEAAVAMEAAFLVAWGRHDSSEMVGFAELVSDARVETFCARWEGLFLGASSAGGNCDGWDEVFAKSLDPDVFDLLWSAFASAWEGGDAEGKPTSAPS